MSPEWQIVTYLVAIVCFLLAAFGVPVTARRPVNLGWVGLALVALVPLVAAIQAT